MRYLKSLLSFLPLSALLFSLSFILVSFFHNIGELSQFEITVPSIAAIIFAFTVYLLSLPLTKNREKGKVFSSLFIIIFFSYIGIFSLLGNIPIKSDLFVDNKSHFALAICFILFLLTFLFVRRLKTRVVLLNRFLLLIAAIITLLNIFQIGHYEISQRLETGPQSPLVLPDISESGLNRNKLPDIYFILPEDYSAPSVLKQYFNYDSTSFLNFLKDKGFYIASESASNYPKSFLSITSMLNMEYLDYLSKYKNSGDQTIVSPLIENNNFLRLVRELGYGYYQMGSWWGPTHFNPLADDNFIIEKENIGSIDDFSYIILESSILRPLITRYLPRNVITESIEDKRKRILYQFRELPEVTKLPSPKFVFTHIIAPHGPYVFDQNCQNIGPRKTLKKTEVENYTNQVSCINLKIEDVINTILKESLRPPVILLQTDEGAPFLGEKVNPADSWSKATTDLLKEKFPIFAAYYLPGVSHKDLYPAISPVNSLRLISNLYFKTDFPILPDKNYIFPDMKHLYQFKDVTAQLNSN